MTDRTNNALNVKQILAKKARLDSYNNRLEKLDGIIPTPGLVSGDFCSTKTKRPKIGTKLLVKRAALWNRCLQLSIHVSVQVFNWATSNKKYGVTIPDALAGIEHEQFLFDRIATAEGHRVLRFLNETERLVLLRINPIFEDSRHNLQVQNMSGDLLTLCEQLANRMDIPFERIVTKLEESKGCWFYMHMHRMILRRLVCILEPHFHKPSTKKAMLIRDRDESFSRWGLHESWSESWSDSYYGVDYFGTDIVDVELYSASLYLSKHFLPKRGLEVITSRVMSEPGSTWVEVTKAYVREEILTRGRQAREYAERVLMSREDKSFRTNVGRRYCRCGNPAAMACSFGECGNCCEGPCHRHGM